MASTKMMFLALCLSVLICGSFSQGRYHGYGSPGQSPSAALTRHCHIFEAEMFREGHGFCDHDVIEEVYKRARKYHGDRSIRQLFRGAFRGELCYSQGAIVATVRNPCQAMELSCSSHTPKAIDYCSTLRAAAARPPVTTRPNVPGRGI